MTNLIVSDYDGTIKLSNEIETLKKNVELLKVLKKSQNKILITTGRLYKSMLQEIVENDIAYNYISCANGNLLFDDELKIMYKKQVDTKIIKQLKPFYSKILEIEALDEFGIVTAKMPFEYLIHIVGDLRVRRQIVNKLLNSSEFDYCTDGKNKFSLHIFNQSDKIQTIKVVNNHLKLNDENIFTIGDGPNDINMLIEYNGYLVGDNILSLHETNKIHKSDSFESSISHINHILSLRKENHL